MAQRNITKVCWYAMLDRCLREKSISYYRYGAVGITVCERWRTFAAFVEDMGPRPSKDYSLDRIDNARGYEPGNCRWATNREQFRNCAKNRWLEHDGRRMILSDWAAHLGMSPGGLRNRLDGLGWSVERALTTEPTRVRQPTHGLAGTYNKGCRCLPCRAASSAESRRKYAKVKLRAAGETT